MKSEIGTPGKDVMVLTSPMVRRQRLGAELKALRMRHNMTGEEVAARLGWRSNSKVSRLELAQSRPNLADILDMLDLYGVEGAKREELVAIARDAANITGWWRSIAGMGPRQKSYIEIETGAAEIRQYHHSLIPGLLQTPEYGRVRVESVRDLYANLDIATEVRARSERQRVLTRQDPPRYEAVLEEAALTRNVAPVDVMRAQLDHLGKLSELPNVTIRVLPAAVKVADFYVPHSAFSLYRFGDPLDPETVVLETLTSDVHLRDEEDVALYKQVFGWVRDAALSPEDSVALLATLTSQA